MSNKEREGGREGGRGREGEGGGEEGGGVSGVRQRWRADTAQNEVLI